MERTNLPEIGRANIRLNQQAAKLRLALAEGWDARRIAKVRRTYAYWFATYEFLLNEQTRERLAKYRIE